MYIEDEEIAIYDYKTIVLKKSIKKKANGKNKYIQKENDIGSTVKFDG
jgi:hypothetical protein